MAKNDNLGKAMFDMFGVGKEGEENGAPVPTRVAPSLEVEKPKVDVQVDLRAAQAKVSENVDASRIEKTYIAPGTVFEGTIQTKGDLDIGGDFRGNVLADGRVNLLSSLTGNITAGAINVVKCNIEGDLVSRGDVVIDAASQVNGNIQCQNIVCAGKVTGDLDIKDVLTLDKSAYINGNIKMGTMQVARGAKISGKLEMQN